MEQFKELIGKVLYNGSYRRNRTGIHTYSVFGGTFEHNMQEGLPLLTTKFVAYKCCIHELLWFLSGDTNIKYLTDNNVHIWDAWADKNGDLGPVYGKQWVCSGPNKVNQVKNVINLIKNDPYSRRIILDAWNPSDLNDMALPPCHVLYQFYAEPTINDLSLQVYMRSADLFLGVPFDIAEGGMLLSLVAEVTGYDPYKLIYNFGDLHIYENHITQVRTMLERPCYKLPKLKLAHHDSIFDYRFNDFEIIDYKHNGTLKGEVAV